MSTLAATNLKHASSASNNIVLDTSGNVGVGISSPLQRLSAVNTSITGGAPASSGSAADPNAVARLQAGSVAFDIGVYSAGQMWLQPRSFTNYATNYDIVLNPNGGNVGIGTSSPGARLGINGGAGTSQTRFEVSTTQVQEVATNAAANAYADRLTDAAQHIWKVTGSERMRIDSSGNVGIGTSSPNPSYRLDVSGLARFTAGLVVTGGNALQLIESSGNNSWYFNNNANNLTFTYNATERMRIDSSGNLLVGLSSGASISGRLSVAINGNNAGVFICDSSNFPLVSWARSGGSGLVYFAHGAGSTLVGTIETNGTGVTYGTSSDYRLKNSIAPIASGLATISALKPVTYKWNINGSDGEGFIAHELQEIIPQAVHGEKDAVNEDGSIKPQGVDYSKIVVHLVAAIQELKADFDAYKAAHP